jgi:hypothetical protein
MVAQTRCLRSEWSWDVVQRGVRFSIVTRVLTLWKLDVTAFEALVRNPVEKVGDDIEAGPLLVIGDHDPPRRPGGIANISSRARE